MGGNADSQPSLLLQVLSDTRHELVSILDVHGSLFGFDVSFKVVIGSMPVVHKPAIRSTVLGLNQTGLDKILAKGSDDPAVLSLLPLIIPAFAADVK